MEQINGGKVPLALDENIVLVFRSIDENLKMRIFNSLTLFGGGTFCMTIGIAPESMKILSLTAFVCFNMVIGLSTVSFCKGIVLYSR